MIAVSNGMLLVAHERGTTDTYLPGIALASAESPTGALERRLQELFSKDMVSGAFVGGFEHGTGRGDVVMHYLDLVFQADLPESAAAVRPRAGVAFEYYWHPVAKLDEMNLLPAGILDLVREHVWSGTKSTWIKG